MNSDEFYAEVLAQQCKLFPNATIKILQRLSTYLKLNILIQENTFISIRSNAENGRQDFALIHQNARIFGYDNLKQWHYHPLEDSSQHIPCAQPSIRQVFEEMKAIIEAL